MSESEFNKTSTAEEVTAGIDLSGKNIVITGVNSGLGQAAMRVLLKRGAHVIGTPGTMDKARLAEAANGGSVTPMSCELSDLGSVNACADTINELDKPIVALICNAGIIPLPALELANGFEQQFNPNHLREFSCDTVGDYIL